MNLLKLTLFITTSLAAPLTLFGCGLKLQQPEDSPTDGYNRVKPWSAKYRQYRKESDGLSQIGIHVTTGEYPITTRDLKKVGAKVSQIASRILADPAIKGSLNSGEKAELLDYLSKCMKNPTINSTFDLNRKTSEKLETRMLAEGPSVLKDATVQRAIIALRGVGALKKLREDGKDAFPHNVDEMTHSYPWPNPYRMHSFPPMRSRPERVLGP